MGRPAPASPALKLYLALNAAAFIGAAALMALLARGVGYSTARLLLVSVAILLGLLLATVVILLQRRPAIENRFKSFVLSSEPRLRLILAASTILFWCLVWFPPQYAREARDYFIAVYPFFLCALLLSGSALIWLTAARGSHTSWWIAYLRQRRTALVVALLVLAAFASVALLAAQFRILHGFEPYWYGAGVPLLAAQVLIALGLAIVALRSETWSGTRRLSADALFFAMIWIVAAAAWAWRSVPPSYWITSPQPPNFELYPFSDLATYDLASQFALIGQGIFNGAPFDRALYMSFLVYLHSIGGQSYAQLMAIQAAIFAVFPAVLYLIGRCLHSRTAGLILAALVTMRGLTSLDASAWIDTANFKHMLTDFPTAIGVAVFLLLTLKWLEAPRERLSYLIWAGGVLGLTSLLRPHVLLLMAALAVLALWVYRPHVRRGVVAAALTSVAFLTGVLPWLTLGPSSGSLVAQYGDRLRAVIAQRFPVATVTLAAATAITPSAEPPPVTPATAPVIVLTPAPVPAVAEIVWPPVDPGPPFLVDHFLHNLITTGLIFPSSPQLLPVRSVVKEGEEFWRPRWTGGMSTLSALMLVLNLAAVAVGVGIASQRHRMRAFIPLGVMLLYLAANSFARTSGGRYIVPVDWIVVLYFAVAMAELVAAVGTSLTQPDGAATRLSRKKESRVIAHPVESAPRPRRAPQRSPAAHPVAGLAFVLMIGGLVPLAGVLFPTRYPTMDSEALIRTVSLRAPEAGTEEDLRLFLQQPDAILAEGRILYPIYYRKGEGEPARYAPYAAQEYPRTVFAYIGPLGLVHVLLPGQGPPTLPDASDAIVLGCRVRGETFTLLHAVAVILPDEEFGLARSPAAPLNCPLPDPICDNNSNCH